MSYQLEFTAEAIVDLEKLTQVVRVRVVKKINWLVENFELLTPQPLSANLNSFYKLRIGDYRVIYSFDDSGIIVIHQDQMQAGFCVADAVGKTLRNI